MKLIIKIAAVVTLLSIVGCDKKDDQPPVKAADTGVFKTQLETLDQAKQVGQMLQNDADQQRQKIEEQTQ